MIIVIQFIHRLIQERLPLFQKAKPFTLHCSLLILVLIYAFFGGLVFNKLESEALIRQQEDDYSMKKYCVMQILNNSSSSLNETVSNIMDCWKEDYDERSEWSYVTSTLYGFGIVTTLGYNRIAPVTHAGRMFCILYGICGIPITMIIIANVGQYLNQFAKKSRIKMEQYRYSRRRLKATGDVPESSIELTSLALLIAFLLYVSFGALLLPLLNGELDFFNGLYFNFLCLTAIDFGQLVPQNVAFLPITFIYVCVGLAITTIAIDVGSEYMKKLHYLGKKMKNAAATKIWFGGKTMKVKDLLHAVGKKCGVEPSFIDAIDLDNVVERVIAINEGRTPPPDKNDDPPPPREPSPKNDNDDRSQPLNEACPLLNNSVPTTARSHSCQTPAKSSSPSVSVHSSQSDLILRNAAFQSQNSITSSSPLGTPCPFSVVLDSSEVVAINVPDEVCDVQKSFSFEQNKPIAISCETVVEQEHYSVAESVELHVFECISVLVVPESPDVEEGELEDVHKRKKRSNTASAEDVRVPRRFREKKQMYGRDARKLYETYQEEWDRLERLSNQRLGAPRRRSVLTHSSHNLLSMDRSPSGERHTSLDVKAHDRKI